MDEDKQNVGQDVPHDESTRGGLSVQNGIVTGSNLSPHRQEEGGLRWVVTSRRDVKDQRHVPNYR